MSRTITVRGVGTAFTKPDWVTLDLQLSAKDMDYERAMELADEQIVAIRTELREKGFALNELKTVNFNVNASYEGYNDEKGVWRNRFDGYVVNHMLRLEFALDTALINDALTAISRSGANPQLGIRFTVHDPAVVKEALLRSAADNAWRKAEVLTEASGVELGRLINIDYNWGSVNVYSNTTCDCREEEACADGGYGNMKLSRVFNSSFTPEDIKSSDSAAFTWEIEDLRD